MVRQHLFCRLHWVLVLLVCCLMACESQADAISPLHVDGPALFPPASATARSAEAAVPLRLLIPVIGVNAAVEQVGIAASGDLDTPSLSPWTDTGWYVNGPRPGEQGSAVIDGHLNQPGNAPAVFWRLYQLRVGNEVIVLDSNGRVLRFLVIDVAYYTPQNAPYQLIFGNTGGRYLNLITCAGDWIPSLQQTTERLVVYTRLI
jgi:sortase (surface protein transpeptidase)